MPRMLPAFLVFGLLAALRLTAQTPLTIATFNGLNGAYPEAGLIQGLDGKLYGTASGGGQDHGGTFFVLTEKGIQTLHTFCADGGPACADGAAPGGLLQATTGEFFGTLGGG